MANQLSTEVNYWSWRFDAVGFVALLLPTFVGFAIRPDPWGVFIAAPFGLLFLHLVYWVIYRTPRSFRAKLFGVVK